MSETATSLCSRTVPDDLAVRWKGEGAWLDVTVGSLLDRGTREHAAVRFRVFSDARPYDGTVGEVAERARRLAGGLARRGLGPGDVVAYQYPNWAEAAVAFWATSLLGVTIVPVVHIYGPKELRYILEHTRARAFLTPDRFGRTDYCEVLPSLMDELTDLELVAVDGDDVPAGAVAISDLLDADPVEAPESLDPDAAARPSLRPSPSGLTPSGSHSCAPTDRPSTRRRPAALTPTTHATSASTPRGGRCRGSSCVWSMPRATRSGPVKRARSTAGAPISSSATPTRP